MISTTTKVSFDIKRNVRGRAIGTFKIGKITYRFSIYGGAGALARTTDLKAFNGKAERAHVLLAQGFPAIELVQMLVEIGIPADAIEETLKECQLNDVLDAWKQRFWNEG